MKLTILLFLLTLQLSVSAWSQQIILKFTNASLREVLQSIRRQSGYNFVASSDELNKANPVSVNLQSGSIDEVLRTLFASQPFMYQLENNIIMIRLKKPERKADAEPGQEQQKDISGIVLDEKGNPLPGVTVILKETNKGTITDQNGRFVLRDGPESGSLIVTMIGRQTRQIKYSNSTVSAITLAGMDMSLKEVEIANKGYYTQQQELNTGSVAVISGETIRKQPVSNPLIALEGRLPGVYISQDNGVPGSKATFEIRGKNSIAAGLDPLFVIDGIPYNATSSSKFINATGYASVSPFNNIRPEDIEEITVLKDADATAIYGSRGANGVVLITTRRGKPGISKFDLNVSHGGGQITRRMKLMDTQQYLAMRNEAFENDDKTPSASDYDVNGAWDKNRYTDWQKVMIGGTARLTTVNGTYSGGSEGTQFLIGASYRNETTVFPGDFNNSIAGLNANINHSSFNKKFSINFSSSYSYNQNKLPQADFTSLIFFAPNAPAIYDGAGNINWESNTFNNPLANNLKTAKIKIDNIISNVSASYRILPSLQLKVSAGFTSNSFTETNLTPFAAVLPTTSDPANNRSSQKGINKTTTWIIEPQLTFNRSFGDHSVDALVGSTFQENEQNGNTINAFGFSSDALLQSFDGAATVYSTSSYSLYRYNAIFARLGYNYAGKYVLNLTGRRDGSSRFGPGKRFGNFGALGVAWIVTKEHFIPQNTFLSFLKIRGSIGKTGNDQISDYNYLETHQSTESYGGVGGLVPYRLANPDYRWETLNKIELAIAFGFFSDRLLLNAAAFRNKTGNQLVGYTLPGITGFDMIIANLPAVIENKGLEIDFTSKNISGKKFSWTTTGNLTIPRNKLLSFPGIESTGYATQYVVGQSLDVGFRWKYIGLNPGTGFYEFADLDKDGTLDAIRDRYPVTRNRPFFGGLGNNLSFSGFSLDIFFQFVKQRGSTNIGAGLVGSPGSFIAGGAYANPPDVFLNRWRKEGDENAYQKYTTAFITDSYVKYIESDSRLTDASFIRLKNVMLSWQLPQKWMQRLKLQAAGIYVQGQNLLTITGYDGLDPENSNVVALPPLRMIAGGINISL